MEAASARVTCGIYNDLIALTFAEDQRPPNRIILKASSTTAEREQAIRDVNAKSTLISTSTPPSLVLFITQTEFACPDDAYHDAKKRFDQCLDSLNNVIRSIQSRLPRQIAWTFRPVTMFDIGVAYHCAEHFCTSCHPPAWRPLSSFPIMSLPRQLASPLCVVSIEKMDLATIATNGFHIDLENELLLGAIAAFFEGHPRLTVLNALLAVEVLANEYFSMVAKADKIKAGISPESAAAEAESERRKHRTELSHLMHRGPQQYHAPSLFLERESLYNALISAYQARKDAAHRGVQHTEKEVQTILEVSCDAVTWLQMKLGKPTTPFTCPVGQLAFRAPG